MSDQAPQICKIRYIPNIGSSNRQYLVEMSSGSLAYWSARSEAISVRVTNERVQTHEKFGLSGLFVLHGQVALVSRNSTLSTCSSLAESRSESKVLVISIQPETETQLADLPCRFSLTDNSLEDQPPWPHRLA